MTVAPLVLHITRVFRQTEFIVSGSDCSLFLYTQSPKLTEEAPGIIKVGDKAIDDHCMRSTMDTDTANMVDKFRQLKLREFCEITKLCYQQGVNLNTALLERGKDFTYYQQDVNLNTALLLVDALEVLLYIPR